MCPLFLRLGKKPGGGEAWESIIDARRVPFFPCMRRRREEDQKRKNNGGKMGEGKRKNKRAF